MNIFTSSGTFEIPKGVKEIEVFVVGGGASGINGGGGSGYTKTENISVNPGDEINISIGSGGKSANYAGNIGGTTCIESIYISGGNNPDPQYRGGDGGSGGGNSNYTDSSYLGGNGGSNGSNGYYAWGSGSEFTPGTGQGTTTRAFGESDGTLYAGGGAGALYYSYPPQYCNQGPGGNGKGGDGGGGNGGVMWNEYCKGGDGGTNTGGGGGGGLPGGVGGSGIAIIRWGY